MQGRRQVARTNDGIAVEMLPLAAPDLLAWGYDGAAERLLVRFAHALVQYENVDWRRWERLQQAPDKAAALEKAVLCHPRRFPRLTLELG